MDLGRRLSWVRSPLDNGHAATAPVRQFRAKPRHPSRARDGSTNQSTLPLNFERLENLAAKIRRDGNPGGTIVKAVSLI